MWFLLLQDRTIKIRDRMLNRHFLRAKTLCALYAYHINPSEDIAVKTKNLLYGFTKLFDTEAFLLASLLQLWHISQIKIEENKNKFLPTQEDLNPSLRFVENTFMQQLSQDELLHQRIAKQKITFPEDVQEILRAIWSRFQGTPSYKEYMAKPQATPADDKGVVVRLFKNYLMCNDRLYDYLCEGYIETENDYDALAQKTLFTLKEYDKCLPEDEFEYDSEYVVNIFSNTIKDNEFSDTIIQNKIQHWEMDRVAIMDIIIIKMGISELMYCPHIPINVTLNEYVDLANEYSTQKSRLFVNGLLDKIMVDLRAEGKIKKETTNEDK